MQGEQPVRPTYPSLLTISTNAYNFTYGYDEMGNTVTKVGNGVNEYYLRDQTGKELAVYKIGTDTISIRNYFGSGLIGKADSLGNNYFYCTECLVSLINGFRGLISANLPVS